ncbi:universal stress protein [bacterium]|nr:universal stress protein [bacterium]
MVWHPAVVVVGIDGSERSLRAAQVAADLARVHSARLVIVTVVRPPEGWWGIVGSPPPAEALASSMSEAQKGILDVAMHGLDLDGLEWEATEEIGDPASALSDVCRDRDADVLVVGRRGAGVLERLVIGSVADRLTHYAPCPVMIVP